MSEEFSLSKVRITAMGPSPTDVGVEIDGKQILDLRALDVKLAVDSPNLVTLTFIPDELEIDGRFAIERAEEQKPSSAGLKQASTTA